MVLSNGARMIMLLDLGVSMNEIRKALEEINQVKCNRKVTMNKMKFSRFEEVMESAARKTKRLLYCREKDITESFDIKYTKLFKASKRTILIPSA